MNINNNIDHFFIIKKNINNNIDSFHIKIKNEY